MKQIFFFPKMTIISKQMKYYIKKLFVSGNKDEIN